jgi:hypothetical protein
LLVKFLDNLPFDKALSEAAVFFLMFSKLSHLMFGWFIQPFHIKDSLWRNIRHQMQEQSVASSIKA